LGSICVCRWEERRWDDFVQAEWGVSTHTARKKRINHKGPGILIGRTGRVKNWKKAGELTKWIALIGRGDKGGVLKEGLGRNYQGKSRLSLPSGRGTKRGGAAVLMKGNLRGGNSEEGKRDLVLKMGRSRGKDR